MKMEATTGRQDPFKAYDEKLVEILDGWMYNLW